MNITKAKAAVLEEWDNWAENPSEPNVAKMREFFDWLEKKRPTVLTWHVKSGADRWQDVRGWLNVRTGYGSK